METMTYSIMIRKMNEKKINFGLIRVAKEYQQETDNNIKIIIN